MADRVKLDTTKLRRAADAARIAVPKAMEKRVTQFVTGGTQLAKAGVQKAAPVFRGILASSLRTDVVGSAIRGEAIVRGKVFSNGAAAVYAGVVDRGRRPGTFPNVGAIRRWVDLKIKRGEITVNLKKLFPDREKRPKHSEIVNALAFRIGQKMKARGTKGKKYVQKGIKDKRSEINRLADRIAELLEADIVAAL